MIRRLERFAVSPFGMATLALAVLAAWALWTGGILDSPMAREARNSSVYADPGFGAPVDERAAERVIGNRRLVALLLPPAADPGDACDEVSRAAEGTLILVLRRADDGGYDRYGCNRLPGTNPEKPGRSAVVETLIGRGTDPFADRPVDALKVAVVNYDLMVVSGFIPDGPRTISPSLPRFLIAAAALAAVILGSLVVWLAGRRAGRLATARADRLEKSSDARASLSAAVSTLAQHIIDLDASLRLNDARHKLNTLTGEYLKLLDDMTKPMDDLEARHLTHRVEQLIGQADTLAGDAKPARSGRQRKKPDAAKAVSRKEW